MALRGYNASDFAAVMSSLSGRPIEDYLSGLQEEHERASIARSERDADEPAPASLRAHSVADDGVSAAVPKALAADYNRGLDKERAEALSRGMTVNELRAWKTSNRSQSPVKAQTAEDGTIKLSEVDLSSAPKGAPVASSTAPEKKALVLPEQRIEMPPAKGSGKPRTQSADQAAAELDRMSGGVAGMSGADASQTPGWGFGSGATSSAAGMAQGATETMRGAYASSQQSTESNRREPDDYRTKLTKLYESMAGHTEAAVNLEAAGMRQQAAEKDALTQQFEQEVARHQQRVAEENNRIARQRAKVEDLTEEVRSAELDKRSYLERNPFSGIALAVGAAIGGAMSARFGGPNQGLDALNRAIDRDIDVQKYNIQKKRGDLDAANNLLASNMKILGDERLATVATRMQLKEASAIRIEQIAASTKSQTLKEQAGLAGDMIRKDLLNLRNEWDVATNTQAQAFAAQRAQQGQGAAQGGKYVDIYERYGVPELLTRTPDGKMIGVSLGKGSVSDEVKKRLVAAKQVLPKLHEIRKLSQELRQSWNPKTAASLKAQIDAAVSDIGQLRVGQRGGGAAAQYELSEVAKQLGNPADWTDWTGGKSEALDAAIKFEEQGVYTAFEGAPVFEYAFDGNSVMGRPIGAFQRSQPLSVTPKK